MKENSFTTSIIGLGLMGGSLGYALRGFKSGSVVGYDINPETARLAFERGAIDFAMESLEEAASLADLVIFCSSPDSIIENMRLSLPYFKQGSVVTDICGVKKDILSFISSHLPPHADYVGLHPMAGKEVGGFINADRELFKNAGFILVLPEGGYKESSVELLRELSFFVGAGRVVVNHGNEHDELIAYSSDLMHIAATALCIDYPSNLTMAHTAGAFRDCTRVARIDADLWTELLTKNSEHIIPHLEDLIKNLSAFNNALKSSDTGFIHAFLKKACENKETILTL